MLKRLSTTFRKDKKEKEAPANGTANQPTTNGTKVDRRRSSLGIKKADSNKDVVETDHSVSREGIAETLEKFGAVLKASNRPLPTQTGDGSYTDTPAKGGLLADLRSLNVRDFETLEMLLKQTLSHQKLTDDKTMVMERIIQLVSGLPSNSANRVTLTNAFIDELWSSLEHPPPNMLGDLYNYRQPDGSYNNVHQPELGKAGSAYARSVPPKTIMPAQLPDPGVIFDALMDRGDTFKPHPNRVSSMLYYIATIIIHDCFRTSHEDFNITTTSSYLDLSPLYGNSKADCDGMRTFENGMLKPDCFAEKRLLGFPPGVGAILIMFNRFHNYCAEQLAAVNENGRFSMPHPGLPEEKKAAAMKKRDENLFQVARLVTGGLYINIILLDYLRTIVNLNRVSSDWTLDPRAEMDRHTGTAAGVGNVVSCEFNLIYRWHSCISDRDDKWTQGVYHKLFGKDYKAVTIPELLMKLGQMEAMMPDDPQQRDFNGLKRGADGKLDDDELVKILVDSIEDVAGASGARNVPQVLRAVEILGMKQARAWNCATLNEFRKFFGLQPHETFLDINSDPEVADQLKHLYDHPDFVELYPGLVAEEAKKPMVPGVGIAPTYTISRSILSDAVTLVRGDRFYTTSYNAKNLTNWGYHEAQYDLNVNQGCVFYKLFLRAFPSHFKFNSIYAHYPLTVPDENAIIMKDLGRTEEFTWEKPGRIRPRVNVSSWEGVHQVLDDNGENFNVSLWADGLKYLMGKPGGDFMLAGDGPFYLERREQMGKCLYHENWEKQIKAFYEDITLELLHRWSYKINGVSQVDIIRDIGNSAHIYFAAAIFHMPLKTEEHPSGIYTEHELYGVMALIFIVIFFGAVDPATTFPLRVACLPLTQQLGQLMESTVGIISKTGFISGITDWIMQEHSALKDYGVHMIRALLKSGQSVHEVTWGHILPTAGAMVANQAQVWGQIMDFYLTKGKEHLPEIQRVAKLDTPESDEILLRYVLEAIRIHGTFGAYRTATRDVVIKEYGKEIPVQKGDNVFAGFVQIAKDPNHYPEPEKVKLDRPLDSYIVYGIGPHKCLGGKASQTALTSMLRVVGRLPNLRPVEGPPGELKKIYREGGYYMHMDPYQSTYFPFPTTMKVAWDGELPPRKQKSN